PADSPQEQDIDVTVATRDGRIAAARQAGLVPNAAAPQTVYAWDPTQDGTRGSDILPDMPIGHTYPVTEFRPSRDEMDDILGSAGVANSVWFSEASPLGPPVVVPTSLFIPVPRPVREPGTVLLGDDAR